jgi:hypothetical protein
MDEALQEISKIEERTDWSWEKKIDKIVWRGTPWFNGLGIPDLRPKLVEETRGREWADVEALEWTGDGLGTARNALRVEEFCKFRFIAYTEVSLEQACDDFD